MIKKRRWNLPGANILIAAAALALSAASADGGACCHLDGTCSVITTCGSCDGDCQLPYTCMDTPCLGACCLDDGSCSIQRGFNCSGIYQGSGTTCDPNPCPQPPPSNDTCATAIAMNIGANVSVNNVTATDDMTPFCGTNTPAGGVWYSLVGNGETITATTCNPGTNIDTIIQVFCDCISLTCVDGNDDDGGCSLSVFHSTVSWCSESGKTYYIIVGGFDTHGNIELSASADGSACLATACLPTGACCFNNGSCAVLTNGQCNLQAGAYAGDNTDCDPNPCPQPPTGACCGSIPSNLAGGLEGCQVLTEAQCMSFGGGYQGDGTVCDPDPCSPPTGACCFSGGFCEERSSDDCAAVSGTYQGDGTICTPNLCPQPPTGACCIMGKGTFCLENVPETVCPYASFVGHTCAELDLDTCQPFGACCAGDGSCTQETQNRCNDIGTYQGDFSDCDPNPCPQPPPTGACCFTDGACTQVAELDCLHDGGSYRGDFTGCESNLCARFNRVSVAEKGSLLAYSKVDLKWDAMGRLTQDTFIDIANDFNRDVYVQMYFVNGDPATPALTVGNPPIVVERSHPGWNNQDCKYLLTAQQATYFSALTGCNDEHCLCTPFTALDPGTLPGRPDPDVPGGRMLRGFIYAWAVNNNGCEIRHNHLKGEALIVNYAETAAWEYNAYTFRCLGSVQGQPCDATCGQLSVNGVEYDSAFDMLVLDFYATGSDAFSTDRNTVMIDTDLTLFVVGADLRQETFGPVTTKAKFDIYNQEEFKRSGTERCITCWDQTPFSRYTTFSNNFLISNLHTDKGKARINGEQSFRCLPGICAVSIASGNLIRCTSNAQCPLATPCIHDPLNQAAPLLGVSHKRLEFSGVSTGVDYAGTTLFGTGEESTSILYDISRPSSELRNPTGESTHDVSQPARKPIRGSGR